MLGFGVEDTLSSPLRPTHDSCGLQTLTSDKNSGVFASWQAGFGKVGRMSVSHCTSSVHKAYRATIFTAISKQVKNARLLGGKS